ncbi:hypothetical protein [Marinobacter zhejiangensis]|uniref:Uncharacterized protein n=1 Tax=Marinobacter zhejiangensis TaxID=488535 RepID=A0A1I4QBD5_9GAMM|nr:hypothetical protein [Marinobacter zhejiangensis]SFM37402.1 hypothetical protein SAMN04487963_2295 [Marinobacter zhejiangensis]
MQKDFDSYLEYIEANRSRFSAAVYEFASSITRYDLNSPHSLHDAWLSSLTVKENRNSERPFELDTTIELVLLGPMHDREISLKYVGVQSYRFEGKQNPYNWADTFHGDISGHEVTATDDGSVVHEIEYVSGSRIVISCKDFACTEYEYTHNK